MKITATVRRVNAARTIVFVLKLEELAMDVPVLTVRMITVKVQSHVVGSKSKRWNFLLRYLIPATVKLVAV